MLLIPQSMQNQVFVFVLICIVQFCLSQHCDLNVPPAKESKFITLMKGWFGKLKKNVEESKEQDCENCDTIRPPGQKSVDAEKDSQTGCRCKITDDNDKFQCVCCFKLKKWDYLICNSAGFTLGNKEVFLVVTVEDQVIVEVHISLEAYWAQLLAKLLSCIPLPPPVAFLSVCFKPSLEKPSKANNDTWVLCIQLKMGILLVPVISIKPKCFQFGGKSSGRRVDWLPQWMKLEGQTDPKVDVSDPAVATVIDEKNYNGAVCLFNTKKKLAGTCSRTPSGSDCDPPTEEIKDKINWKPSIAGETPFLAVLHQEKYPKPTDDVHGDDNVYPYISSALERASREKWMNESEKITLIQPGRTCGGALLTPNKVLTTCACVRTFYYLHKLKKDPGEDVIDNPFDIQSSDIYVEFSGVTYTAAVDYALVKDEDKFMHNSYCAEHIEKGDTWLLQTSVIVMTFAPEIKHKIQYVPWPPVVFKGHKDWVFMEAQLVGFGMEPVNQSWFFRNASGEVFDFDASSVDIYMRPCKLTDYSKRELNKQPHLDLQGTVSGFCSSDPGFQLCYGKIGLPLTTGRYNRQLVGLSSLPIDCSNEGSTAGAVFSEGTISEIEKYLANAHLICSRAWLHLVLFLLLMIFAS